MIKAIVWQERYTCNFKCPYCGIYGMKCDGDMKSADEWIAAFNRLMPGTLDITGGEPFLNKDLVKIINGLSPSIRIGITTNLTHPIMQYVKEVSPAKVISMTLSYHPSQTGITKDAFIGKAMLLASRGFNVNVNFVAYPEQMLLIPTLKAIFESLGIRFHVDPYAAPENEQFQYTPDEREFLKHFVGQDRQFRINGAEREVMCSGGMNYMQVDPAGNAYRCMTHHLQKMKPIGNIHDPAFKVFDELKRCSVGDLCGGCDRDKVDIERPQVIV